MATAGPSASGTAVDDNSVGTVTWSNPGNVAASDNTYATITAPSGAAVYAHYLKCTNFGFSVPSGATIDGVTVSIDRYMTNSSGNSQYVRDDVLRLVVGGTISGANKAVSSNWPSTETTLVSGGAADLWTLTLSDTDVNASTFGVVLGVILRDRFAVGGVVGYVDLITITIDYTAGGGGGLSIPAAMQSYRQRRV